MAQPILKHYEITLKAKGPELPGSASSAGTQPERQWGHAHIRYPNGS